MDSLNIHFSSHGLNIVLTKGNVLKGVFRTMSKRYGVFLFQK